MQGPNEERRGWHGEGWVVDKLARPEMLSQETVLTPWLPERPQLSWVSESLSPGYEPSYLDPPDLDTFCLTLSGLQILEQVLC